MNNVKCCDNCDGQNWVCEEHPDTPWLLEDGSSHCGAPGIPCKKCNPCDYDNPPRELRDFKVILDHDGFHPQIVGGKDAE